MKYIIGSFGLLYKIYIAVIFTATLLIFYPLIVFTLFHKKTKKWSFPLHVGWSFTVQFLVGVWVHKVRKAQLPKAPYLIVSNHTSYFDIFFMYALLPQNRFLFLGKSELLSYPLIKTLFKHLNIPVFRKDRVKAARSYKRSVEAIHEGWSLVIFPEGGIPDENLPEMIPFKDGAFKLAKRCNVPIVPITFLNHFHMFTDPGKILGSAHPGISKVYFHDAISVSQQKQLTEKELSDLVFETLAKPLREQGFMKHKA